MRSRRMIVGLLIAVVALGSAATWLWPMRGRKVLRNWWYWRHGPHHGLFQDPEGLAFDSKGNLYVGDEKRGKITMFDASTGSVVATLGAASGNRMVITDPGRVYFLHPRNGTDHVIEVSMTTGKELRSFSIPPAPGSPQFAPEGLCFDESTGELYVADEDGPRVVVFDRDGRAVRTFTVDHLPEDVRLFEDRVYLTMPKVGWVSCYGKDGSFRFKFGQKQLSAPETIAISSDRKVYVSDNVTHKIEVYDLEGRHSFTIGGPGKEPGRFYRPQDIAFDKTGNLYVADSDNHRVQVLSPAGAPLRIIQ